MQLVVSGPLIEFRERIQVEEAASGDEAAREVREGGGSVLEPPAHGRAGAYDAIEDVAATSLEYLEPRARCVVDGDEGVLGASAGDTTKRYGREPSYEAVDAAELPEEPCEVPGIGFGVSVRSLVRLGHPRSLLGLGSHRSGGRLWKGLFAVRWLVRPGRWALGRGPPQVGARRLCPASGASPIPCRVP
jgi:hypothetical protein